MLFNQSYCGLPNNIKLLDIEVFEAKVSAIEYTIKAYTNNSFIDRATGAVNYPPSVVAGAVKMLIWDMQSQDKIGIKTESLSRHSVTYVDQDAANTVMGYPMYLIGFLKPYMKARF
ncbi:MAG: hypothetical protein RR219_08470 [Clostridiales bacterium]